MCSSDNRKSQEFLVAPDKENVCYYWRIVDAFYFSECFFLGIEKWNFCQNFIFFLCLNLIIVVVFLFNDNSIHKQRLQINIHVKHWTGSGLATLFCLMKLLNFTSYQTNRHLLVQSQQLKHVWNLFKV